MQQYTILTFSRFVYLNTYAFILIFLGLGIGFIAICVVNWIFRSIFLVICVMICRSSLTLFMTWSEKKRKYAILIAKNTPTINLEPFNVYMQAPCGRLLVRVVLKDLGCFKVYSQLLSVKKPILTKLKDGCLKTDTKIFIYDDK